MRSLIIVGLMIGLVGCDESIDGLPDKQTEKVENKVEKKVEEAVDAVEDPADQQKRNLLDSVTESLKDFDTQLDSLKERGSKLTEEAKANWETKRTQLEAQRLNLQEKLDELRDSSGDSWMELKEGVKSAWLDLKESFDDVAREMKDD